MIAAKLRANLSVQTQLHKNNLDKDDLNKFSTTADQTNQQVKKTCQPFVDKIAFHARFVGRFNLIGHEVCA